MYTILHNSRCGKSREAIKLLEDNGINFEIREYLKDPLSLEEIKDILELLNLKPIDLVRTKEIIWKENFKNKNLSDKEILTALSENPILIERPVIYNNKKGVIGRPIEKVKDFLNL